MVDFGNKALNDMAPQDELKEADFEKFVQNQKPLTDEEFDDFLKHPLNCRELTPEMLELPEYQGLQALAYDGSSSEIASNFLDHGLKSL